LPWSGEEDGKGRQVVVIVSPNKQLNHRSVLEGRNESWNAGTEMNPRSVKMPAMTRQDWFQNTIE
jgi:hypothetical protein